MSTPGHYEFEAHPGPSIVDGHALSPSTLSLDAGRSAARESVARAAAHCTIVAVDIEGFGQRHRSNANRVRIRRGLYEAMRAAFEGAGIPWLSCHREDRGDGILILCRAETPKALFVDSLPGHLALELTRHNSTHPQEEQMRLRLALHAGEITYDDYGVTGYSIIHAFRILDTPSLKVALAGSSAILAIIGSEWFFDEVIQHSESSNASSYVPVEVKNKETETRGWTVLVSASSASRPLNAGSRIPRQGSCTRPTRRGPRR
ncbi:hypothetical protein [Amycolatopsis azurea]|uniref:Guanylate cyclase domain-containing protein n=1 Tax=Amycolatopsis azurea DSM 43854 TaxID=1238180 RepID=M2PZ28_9PSEU|nr:hypothetical protein [Amycolatopsis azurea]EMD24920.1 hypothetical protein C791_5502 [Amycolatopsis azurea DSM 43854]OOC07719.1 hypothetical protein B0293_06185 [Amycolatopsis azurea DSM 43854]